ncbi:MAG: class B sortase [Lachnospiraceae bacterium]|nr:class B sortase [Lachnospiraceae bacterium]
MKKDEIVKKLDGRRVGRDIYRLTLFVFLVIGGATAVFALAELTIGFIGYLRTRRVYDDANRRFVSAHALNQDEAPATVSAGTVSSGSVSGDAVEDEIDVDIRALREINNEVIGWIYFDEGLISYPILFSGDNEYYLKRNYMQKYMASGSIFMDKNGSTDFSDHYTLLYGHNMRDLTMFGKLRYYRTDKDYIKEHEYFRIITENHEYRYRIFSYKPVDSMGPVFTAIDKDSDGLAEFAKNNLMAGNVIQSEVTSISDEDHVLALSTCMNDYAFRFIVCGVRVSDKKLGNGKDEVLPKKSEVSVPEETVSEDEADSVSEDEADSDEDEETAEPSENAVVLPDTNTLLPGTTIPNTTIPNTTIPNTTIPNTMLPNTTIPDATVPGTAIPGSTLPADNTANIVNVTP